MEPLKVWNLYEVEVDPEDGDDGVERHVGTYASPQRARQAVVERHPGAEVYARMVGSGGTISVVDVGVVTYRVERMEVVS